MSLPFENVDSIGGGKDLVKEVACALMIIDPNAPSRMECEHRQSRHRVVRIADSPIFCLHILKLDLLG